VRKRRILNSYPDLTEVVAPDGRISYVFEGSTRTKKQIARELVIQEMDTFMEVILIAAIIRLMHGWINIRDLGESELRALIICVMESFISS
jgi:hypothetical protein